MGLDLTSKIIGVKGKEATILSKAEANFWKDILDDAEEYSVYNYDNETVEKIVYDSSESFYNEATKNIESRPCKIQYKVFNENLFKRLKEKYEKNLKEYEDSLSLMKEALYRSATAEVREENINSINGLNEMIQYVKDCLDDVRYAETVYDYVTTLSISTDKEETDSYDNYYLVMEYYD